MKKNEQETKASSKDYGGDDDDDVQVQVRVFTAERVASTLNISEECLVDFTLVCSNDFSSLLDERFDVAMKLHFPKHRVRTNRIFPYSAARWIQYHMNGASILSNFTFLEEMEQDKKGFLKALFEMYRFYGYEKLFEDKFPLIAAKTTAQEKEAIIVEDHMSTYLNLLDHHLFPTIVVDVMKKGEHTLSPQFDILTCVEPLGLRGRSGSFEELTRDMRGLLYYAANPMDVVNNWMVMTRFGFQWMSRRMQLTNCNLSKVPGLKELQEIPIDDRLPEQVSAVFQALTLSFVYGENEAYVTQAQRLLDSLESLSSGFKIVNVSIGLLLYYRGDRTTEHREKTTSMTGFSLKWIQLLVITAVACMTRADRENQNHVHYTAISGEVLKWQVYAIASAYRESLRTVYMLRSILGDRRLQQEVNVPLYSAEDFGKVCEVARVGVAENTEEESESEFSNEEINDLWHKMACEFSLKEKAELEGLCTIRTIMEVMKELMALLHCEKQTSFDYIVSSTKITTPSKLTSMLTRWKNNQNEQERHQQPACRREFGRGGFRREFGRGEFRGGRGGRGGGRHQASSSHDQYFDT